MNDDKDKSTMWILIVGAALIMLVVIIWGVLNTGSATPPVAVPPVVDPAPTTSTSTPSPEPTSTDATPL